MDSFEIGMMKQVISLLERIAKSLETISYPAAQQRLEDGMRAGRNPLRPATPSDPPGDRVS